MANPQISNSLSSDAAKIEKLTRENAELKARLDRMEQLMRTKLGLHQRADSLGKNLGASATAEPEVEQRTTHNMAQQIQKPPIQNPTVNENAPKQKQTPDSLALVYLTDSKSSGTDGAESDRGPHSRQNGTPRQMGNSSLGAASIGTEGGTQYSGASQREKVGAGRSDKHRQPESFAAAAPPTPPVPRNGTPTEARIRENVARNSDHAHSFPSKPISQAPTFRQVPSDDPWEQVPADAGMAEPIPVARSVSAAELPKQQPRKTRKKRGKRRKRKINFYAVATGTGVGIYKCWDDMKHLVAGRNERLLHEGFKTYKEAQEYVARHRNHHVGAKQQKKWDAARRAREAEAREAERAQHQAAYARARATEEAHAKAWADAEARAAREAEARAKAAEEARRTMEAEAKAKAEAEARAADRAADKAYWDEVYKKRIEREKEERRILHEEMNREDAIRKARGERIRREIEEQRRLQNERINRERKAERERLARREAEAKKVWERVQAARRAGWPNRAPPSQEMVDTQRQGYRFYAVADRQWGVFDNWDEVDRMRPRPRYFQGFNSKHAACMWLERQDDIPEEELLGRPKANPPETIDLTACNTEDAVTLDDVKRKVADNVRHRVEARVVHHDRSKARPADRVQSKVTSFFQRSQVQQRMRAKQKELSQAIRAARADAEADERMHKNIATANQNEQHYSRLISAEFMQDEERRHTSEEGESSSLPHISWTPESNQSNKAEAWPSRQEANRHPAVEGPSDHSLCLPEFNDTTDPSRSETPQPRVNKSKNQVIAVSDSSDEGTVSNGAPAKEYDAEATNAKASKAAESNDKAAKQSYTKGNAATEQRASTAAKASANAEPAATAGTAHARGSGMSAEIATWGQMILDGKSGTVPTIKKLKYLKDLQKFRLAYDKYTDEVQVYNMSHAIKIKPNPVISCVDQDLWRSISQEVLDAEHMTDYGEKPNNSMVECYVLGKAPYQDAGKHAATSISDTLSSVRFKRGPTGSTNMGRWIDYIQRMKPVLKKIPAAQKDSKQYRTMYADCLRKAVQPARLREMVDASVLEGLDPSTGAYNHTLLEAKKNPRKMMSAIRNSAKALDALIRQGILTDEWTLTKEICQNFLRGKCKLGDSCTRSHKRSGGETGSKGHGHGNSNNKSNKVCFKFLKGTCTLGDKCKFKHTQQTSSSGTGKPNPLQRCRYDLENKKCKFGEKCWHAHRSSVNPRKDADPDLATKLNKFKRKTCLCCGAKGHEVKDCRKLQAHLDEIKKAVGYTGNINWFNNPSNAKRCQDLFRQNREWRLATTTTPSDLKGAKQPFKLEENWIDGGWCSIGSGDHQRQVRLLLDLGAQRSFGSASLFPGIAKDIREGNLGAARIASEIKGQWGEAFNGKRSRMYNWVQLALEADNVAGTPTIVPATYIALCRECEEEVIVAGKDLCNALGYLTPVQQKKQAAMGGVSDDWLGAPKTKRAYVLSKDTKAKIEENRKNTIQATRVRPQGTMYVGERALANTKLVQWVQEPLIKVSYITTACLGSAGTSAKRQDDNSDKNSDFSMGRMHDIAEWLRSEDEHCCVDKIQQVVTVDVVRVLREIFPLRRLLNVKFKVIQSTHMRAVLGQNVLNELERQDYDAPDPLQSDIGYDEKKDIKNYLEASLDRGILAGLPKKYIMKYRDLILKEYFRVFRPRLGRDTAAHFAPMSVKTIPGAVLRKGYSIDLSNLPREALDSLKKQLDLNKAMGVVSDDVPAGAVLHSLLTVKKPDGSLRWVITAITANDITVEFYHYQADNADELQSIVQGAKHYWVADLTKGYWQIRLAEDSQWLFCFATPWGAYKYLRAPMGSKATAPYFDKCMAGMLEGNGLLRKGVVMIHDDHAGYSDHIYDSDPEGRSHFHLLRRYLKMCAELNVFLSPKKFEVYIKKTDIAGHLHGDGGLRPNPPVTRPLSKPQNLKRSQTYTTALAR